ncbi:hypothetical protein GF325_13315 [Candidatus Bathyarchaeota archaeon]|nr:hypothetical protein [Candidatus Bathyarchaeota archaeon]
MDPTGMIQLKVPNFNDAVLKIVFFHAVQSVPILTYDFKETSYNFDEQLLSGMISAILTVSEEIDKEHTSLLRKIDQTRYDIIVEMKENIGIVLFTLKRENERILRDFAIYLLSEFEKRYGNFLEEKGIEACFEENMFTEFKDIIHRTTMVPITLSSGMFPSLQKLITSYAEFSILICDKLIFTPIFKHTVEYLTPNEFLNISTFLRDTCINSTRFLEKISKFGDFDSQIIKTKKRTIHISDLGEFFCIIMHRRSITKAKSSMVDELLDHLRGIVARNTVTLTIRQKTLLYEYIGLLKDMFPATDVVAVQDLLIKGLNEFQLENGINLERMDETIPFKEKKEILVRLVDYMLPRVEDLLSSSDKQGDGDFSGRITQLREDIVNHYENLSQSVRETLQN